MRLNGNSVDGSGFVGMPVARRATPKPSTEKEENVTDIKVPSEMVYYLERDAQAERLLCWIPPGRYPDVAKDGQVRERLGKIYIRGIEVRVQSEELEAEGIRLSVDCEDLIEAYRDLRNRGALHSSGMVIASTLEQYAKAMKATEDLDSTPYGDTSEAAGADSAPDADRLSQLVIRAGEQPSMTGDEEPLDAFQRLSVRQKTGSRGDLTERESNAD
jgi:hypothetical protein